MADAYRKLCEGLPPRRAPDGLAFPTEPKRVAGWIEALPRANQAATYRQLSEALDALAGVRFEGGVRLALMEALRPVVNDAIAALGKQAQGGTVPLAPAKARVVEQLAQFEHALAHGYRLAAVEYCAPSGAVPFLRGGSVVIALERALYHGSRCLMHSYFVYQSPRDGDWQRLHAGFLFARQCKLQDKTIEDPAEGRAVTCQGLYLQALVLALSNPYRFSQKDQIEVGRLAGDLVAGLAIEDRSGSKAAFAIPVDLDEGPGYIPEERADDKGVLLWFDLGGLRELIDSNVANSPTGTLMLRPKGGRTISTSAELLRRVRGGWASAATRRTQRLSSGHELQAVIGLAGVHFYLSGQLDFESFLQQAGIAAHGMEKDRAAWTHAAVDAGRIPVYTTEVLDQSLGGYRVRWGRDENVRARVGELVGLSADSSDDDRQWMLAVVRWLRYESDGSVDAGLELLSRRGRAVAVRAAEGTGSGRLPQRGVQYNPVRGDVADTLHVAVASAMESITGRVEVVRVSDSSDLELPEPARETLMSFRVLEHSGDFLLSRLDRQATA